MSNKKTILNEATLEYNEILKAAKELALNEGIDKVNKLIKENLSNNIKSKEPIEESFQNDGGEESIPFDEKIGGNEEPNSSEDNQNVFNEALEDDSNDEINLSEMSFEELEETFNNADDEDEFNIDNISSDDLNAELNNIEIPTDETGEQPDSEMGQIEPNAEQIDDEQLEASKLEKLSKIHDEIGSLISMMQDEDDNEKLSSEFDNHMQTIYGEGYREKLGENYDNLFTIYKQNKSNNMDNEKEVSEGIENLNLDDKNTNNQEEEIVDESHGSQLSLNKRAGADVQPRPEFAQYKENKLRAGIQEGVDKRIETLINENKKLKKQLTEINESKSSVSKTLQEKNNLLEKYINVLENYRTRLNEMVVFNTNLANVNNLLVNEELTLSTKDKERIIESFKTVSTIDESKNKYGELLVEMKTATVNNVANIVKKVDSNIESSSKQLVNEMVEKTSFSPEIKKMMDKINYQHKK